MHSYGSGIHITVRMDLDKFFWQYKISFRHATKDFTADGDSECCQIDEDDRNMLMEIN